MERLRPDSNVKSWLFTILRNIWLNQLRQRKSDVVDLDSDEYGENRAVDSSKDPHAAYVSDLEREQVRHAIEQLPLESREIILLREYEELSYEEIAAMLKCPVGTVMSRLARARSKLRDLLAATTVGRQERRPTTQRTPSVGSGNVGESARLLSAAMNELERKLQLKASVLLLLRSGIFSSFACFVVGTAALMTRPF
jgi:RNA polymerase sigma factor (sigma-70 family)